jgi:hypothetical protein
MHIDALQTFAFRQFEQRFGVVDVTVHTALDRAVPSDAAPCRGL